VRAGREMQSSGRGVWQPHGPLAPVKDVAGRLELAVFDQRRHAVSDCTCAWVEAVGGAGAQSPLDNIDCFLPIFIGEGEDEFVEVNVVHGCHPFFTAWHDIMEVVGQC
jgi:hypothetical protein